MGHEVKIKKEDKNYFVEQIKIKWEEAQNGLDITWFSDDTNFIIWFPEIWKPFDKKFPMDSKKESNALTLRLKKKDLLKGKYPYCIYCRKDKVMVEGNSSPVMIID